MRTARHLDISMPRRPQLIRRPGVGTVLAMTLLAAPQYGCLDAAGDLEASDLEASELELIDDTSEALEADTESGDTEPMAARSVTATAITKVTVTNPTGIARTNEPVRVGIPLPKELGITNLDELTLTYGTQAIPLQASALARWNSTPTNTAAPLRWVLLSFQATVPASGKVEYTLNRGGTNPNPSSALSVADNGDQIDINTGKAQFSLRRSTVDLFTKAVVNGVNIIKAGNGVVMRDKSGVTYTADLTKASTTIESRGKMDTVVRIKGSHVKSGSTTTLLNYTLRLTFFAGRSDVRVSYTLHNAGAASHSGNVWPLGDPGSRHIEDLSLVLPLVTSTTPAYLMSEGSRTHNGQASSEVKIYQDSSGGNNYKSENHMNASRWIPITFKGYKVTNGSSTLATGTRVQPWLDVSTSQGGITVGVREFWQNFPKALAYKSGSVRVGLFPTEFADSYEIQGGEQKTHEVSIFFHPGAGSSSAIAPVMAAMSDPLIATPSSSSWYFSSGGFLYEESTRQGQKGASGSIEATYDTLVYPVGKTARSYTTQWELIDAYGWRNYGDVMSDYENNCYEDVGSLDTPLAHYNNQYDYVYGAMRMFARTQDKRFLDFGLATARHTVDVDVYHTTAGYKAYNGGMFWHTTHNVEADTSSHRSYPVKSVSSPCTQYVSGGPSLGHLYVDGVLMYFYMTGDPIARDAIVELANHAVTRYSSYGDEGDGRAMGNLLQTLVNAYRLTGDSKYYSTAVSALNTKISSRISSADGSAWMDAMLGKALGRFLDMKVERGQSGDTDFKKAQSLLSTLAQRVYSRSYSTDVTLTWWSDVLIYAWKHCGKNSNYMSKGKSLYSQFENGYWARGTYPHAKDLAIMVNAGHMARYYRSIGY